MIDNDFDAMTYDVDDYIEFMERKIMSGKMYCEVCSTNLSMSGAELCEFCDPDITAIIERKVKRKSPTLCDKCFEEHLNDHYKYKKEK